MGLIDYVSNLWQILPWFLGLGTIAWIVLALLAPSILEIIKPFLKLGVNVFVDSLASLWEGLKYILDSTKAIFVVVLLLVVTLNYVSIKQRFFETDRPQVTRSKVKSKVSRKVTKNEDPLIKIPGWIR